MVSLKNKDTNNMLFGKVKINKGQTYTFRWLIFSYEEVNISSLLVFTKGQTDTFRWLLFFSYEKVNISSLLVFTKGQTDTFRGLLHMKKSTSLVRLCSPRGKHTLLDGCWFVHMKKSTSLVCLCSPRGKHTLLVLLFIRKTSTSLVCLCSPRGKHAVLDDCWFLFEIWKRQHL